MIAAPAAGITVIPESLQKAAYDCALHMIFVRAHFGARKSLQKKKQKTTDSIHLDVKRKNEIRSGGVVVGVGCQQRYY